MDRGQASHVKLETTQLLFTFAFVGDSLQVDECGKSLEVVFDAMVRFDERSLEPVVHYLKQLHFLAEFVLRFHAYTVGNHLPYSDNCPVRHGHAGPGYVDESTGLGLGLKAMP